MATNTKNKNAHRTTFGDWQTPPDLVKRICSLINKQIKPQLVFEPNCGKGTFLRACIKTFPDTARFLGLEINADYVRASQAINHNTLEIVQGDFFRYEWAQDIKKCLGPILIIGNPPWVTNAELMRLQSSNLPKKSNINGAKGIDAIMGKSNFDISEWMLIRELEAIQGKDALLAMLCKTSTARKVVSYAWQNALQFSDADIRKIDAKKHFNVMVDACLLLIRVSPDSDTPDRPCAVYPSLEETVPKYTLRMRNSRLVSNAEIIDHYADLVASGKSDFVWRSGIKHDCAKVMELIVQPNNKLLNGFGKIVDIEKELLLPMLKSSDLANGNIKSIKRMMVVPQLRVGEDTSRIASLFPKAWKYLQAYANLLDKRSSAIYKNKPRFSIFGVGNYSFKPWKVAIAGLYKNLHFRVIGPYRNKPVVLDDTCYLLACNTENEACLIKNILESKVSTELLNACIFWDSKRPITRDVLSVIDIVAIADFLGLCDDLLKACPHISRAKQSILSLQANGGC